MTDIAITAALMFGFALACVLSVVYLLSKRQINVTQNNDNRTSVTADRTDSGPGLGIQRFVIKWAFIMIVAGIVISAAVNAIADVGRSITTALQSSAPAAVTAPPAVWSPQVAQPPVAVEVDPPAFNPIAISIPILAGAAASIWGNIIINLIKIKRKRTPRAISREQREQRLEDMLPDIVNDL